MHGDGAAATRHRAPTHATETEARSAATAIRTAASRAVAQPVLRLPRRDAAPRAF